MESNTQTQTVNGGAGAASSNTQKPVREATAEEKRFAAHIKQIPHNLFKTIVYYI